jgi:putative membrane protein
MKFIGKIILFIFVNAFAIFLAAYLVKNFVFQGNFIDLLTAAFILTLINVFIRPVLKFLLMPLINLTFGILAIALNAFFLHLLDKFSPSIIINGLKPLFLATVIISFVNILINLLTKLGD